MAKNGRPFSDTEIRPETPCILEYLEGKHYDSPEWNRGSQIKNRGLGNVEVNDEAADSVYQVDTIPDSQGKA